MDPGLIGIKHTDGEPWLYWVPDEPELIVVRLVTDTLAAALEVAAQLSARGVFRQLGWQGTVARWECWAVRIRVPLYGPKHLVTNDHAPLIMWAAAKGGI